MHIEHNLHGGRTVVSERNGKRIVTTGRHGGYVQKAYMTHGGHSYYSRTFYDHGHYRTGVYRGYNYRGYHYYGYHPGIYYHPGFYGWAANPWPGPVYWGVGAWGWGGAPWYAYYGFTPYASYPGPAFWLTDYLIAANLQAAYAAQADSVPAAQGLPLRIVENENSSDSPIWTFNGRQGIGDFGTGHQPLVIEKFDGATIAVRRTDTSGPWHGSALYVGQIDGNLVSGQVTYYDVGGGTRTGGWHGTVQSWSPTSAGGGDSAAANTQSMPPTLNECEGGTCGTWTWDGTQYNALWANGSVGIVSVVRWDGDSIELTRMDTTGRTAGVTATYSGRILTPTTMSGSASYSWPGHPGGNHQQAWNASSPTPVLAASTARPSSAPVSGSDPVALSPEAKQAIAEEVKAQLAAEQAAAGQGSSGQTVPSNADEVPPALDPARRTFVVSADLAVDGADNQECSLTQGDILMRIGDTPDSNQKVSVSVASSKNNDCAAGKQITVSVDDLQEMRNRFQEQLDDGMKTLASKQGTGKMPRAPDTNTVASDVPPATPDTTAANDLQQQQAAADQTESDVKKQASSTSAGGQL